MAFSCRKIYKFLCSPTVFNNDKFHVCFHLQMIQKFFPTLFKKLGSQAETVCSSVVPMSLMLCEQNYVINELEAAASEIY